MKSKILILTDSLGLPRCQPEETEDEDVWVYKLMDDLADSHKFRLLRQRGMDSRMLIENIDSSLKAYKNIDTVIVQVGIVDCYPRTISRETLRWLNKTPKWFQNAVHSIVKAHPEYFICRADNRFVKPNEYRKNLEKLKAALPNSEFLAIPIGPACSFYASKNSKVKASIEEYNAVLQSIFGNGFLNEIFQVSDLDKMYLSDGHHLSTEGHLKVYEAIKKKVQD